MLVTDLAIRHRGFLWWKRCCGVIIETGGNSRAGGANRHKPAGSGTQSLGQVNLLETAGGWRARSAPRCRATLPGRWSYRCGMEIRTLAQRSSPALAWRNP